VRIPGAALAAVALLPSLARAALGPIYGGELTLSVPDLPARLEPAPPDDASHRLALGLVHETLLRIDEAGRLGPGLARASAAASGLEWRLDLEPDVRFHDDAPVTAEDALRSIRRFLDAGSPAAAVLRESLAPDGVAVLGSGSLVLRFREPAAGGPRALASLAAAVTSPSGAAAGPFLPTLAVPGQRLALTAFAGHVRGRPYLDRVTLVAQPDPARRASDAAGGRVAIALDSGPDPGLTAPAQRLLLAIDATRPPCDRADVRAAIAHAAATADLVSFAGGTALASAGPAPPAAAIGPLRLVVAADVPPAASQRLAAVLEAAGARPAVVVLAPREARSAPAPLRLFLDAPEVRDATVETRQASVLSGGREDGLLPLLRLPLRVASDPRVRGLVVAADTRLELADAWLAP